MTVILLHMPGPLADRAPLNELTAHDPTVAHIAATGRLARIGTDSRSCLR